MPISSVTTFQSSRKFRPWSRNFPFHVYEIINRLIKKRLNLDTHWIRLERVNHVSYLIGDVPVDTQWWVTSFININKTRSRIYQMVCSCKWSPLKYIEGFSQPKKCCKINPEFSWSSLSMFWDLRQLPPHIRSCPTIDQFRSNLMFKFSIF